MVTRFIFGCEQGENIGELLKVELNGQVSDVLDGRMYLQDGKLYFFVIGKERKQIGLSDNSLLNRSFSSEHGDYRLLISELHTPDYSKNRRFERKISLDSRDIDEESIERLKKSLNESQMQIVTKISGSLKDYVFQYLAYPLKIIGKQNRLVSSAIGAGAAHAKSRPLIDYSDNMVGLNALVEREVFCENKNQKKTPENTVELKNVEYLIDGDYIPSTGSFIGQEKYEIGKGNIIIRKTDPLTRRVLTEAKIAGAALGDYPLKAALRVYQIAHDAFPPTNPFAGRGTGTNCLDEALKNGGVCINKAIMTQLALQEAGIKSRFVRGQLAGTGGYHAWSEADIFGSGEYALILDPNLQGGSIYIKGDGSGDFVYRLKSRKDGCMVPVDYFNIVWRSK